MRRMSMLGWAILLLVGCGSVEPIYVGNSRPAIHPEPSDAGEEKRDARFFLAYPDDSVAPPSGMLPRDAR